MAKLTFPKKKYSKRKFEIDFEIFIMIGITLSNRLEISIIFFYSSFDIIIYLGKLFLIIPNLNHNYT